MNNELEAVAGGEMSVAWKKVEAALKNLQEAAKASTVKLGELKGALAREMPKYGSKGAEIQQKLASLDALYARRRLLIAEMRHAVAYTKACAKAGINPKDVVQRISSYSNRNPLYGRFNQRFITEVGLKDGRRVEIDPVELSHE